MGFLMGLWGKPATKKVLLGLLALLGMWAAGEAGLPINIGGETIGAPAPTCPACECVPQSCPKCAELLVCDCGTNSPRAQPLGPLPEGDADKDLK